MHSNENREYFAFISYQRKDEEWAKWLAHELEHYHLPITLNGRKDLPKNLRPIFRDIDELAAGNLPKQIHYALESSKNLVVICSPNSAMSKWVNKEVEEFISMGKTDRIFPFIIDGVAMSHDINKECFPPALRNLPKQEERLGGNINEKGRDAAVVKIIAGMLELNFDTLWQRYERDKAEEERKIKEQRDRLLKIQSRFLAEKSIALASDGDAMIAQRLALEALPKDFDNPDRPYVAEAEYALRFALEQDTSILRNDATEYISSAVYSPDGDYIIGAAYCYINVWSTKDGRIASRFKVLDYSIKRMALHPNGNIVAVSSIYENVIKIWDIPSQSLKSIIGGPLGEIRSIEFSCDGDHLLAACNDHSVRAWAGEDEFFCMWFKHPVVSASFCHDNKKFTAVLDNGAVYVCDLEHEQPRAKIHCGTLKAVCARFSPDGREIAVGFDDGTIHVYDSKHHKEKRFFEGHTQSVNTLCFSHDGCRLISTSYDIARIWDLEKASAQSYIRGFDHIISSASFSPDDKYAIASSHDGTIKIIPFTQGDCMAYIELPDEVLRNQLLEYLKLDRCTNCLFLQFDTTIVFHDMNTGENVCFSEQFIHKTVHSKNHPLFATASDIECCNVRIWSTKERNCIANIRSNEFPNAMFFTPDGNLRLCWLTDGVIIIKDTESTVFPTVIHSKEVRELEFAEMTTDGLSLLIFGNGTVTRIDLTTDSEVWKCDSSISGVVSPDGKFVAVADGYDVVLIDFNTGNKVKSLKGHIREIRDIAFSPDGKTLAASALPCVNVWDVESEVLLRSYPCDRDFAMIDFSTNGDSIFVTQSKQVAVFEWKALHELVRIVHERFKDNKFSPTERRAYNLE